MYEKRITSVCTRSYTFAEQSARWEWKIERETGADWNRIGDCCYETQVSEKNKNATSFRMWCKVREKSVHITDAQLHACVRLALSVCVWFVCTFHGSQNTKWNERARARVRIAKEPMTKTPSHQHIYYSIITAYGGDGNGGIDCDRAKEWERYSELSEACEQECCGSMCLMHD